jgi:hypothetical protein
MVGCCQNRYKRMLTLPDYWPRCVGGKLAEDLLAQIRHSSRRDQAAALLLRASLHIAAATAFHLHKRLFRVVPLSKTQWRISDLIYAYFPVVDDDVLHACLYSLSPENYFVIVPSRYEFVLQQSLKNSLGPRSPTILTFDGAISWRTSFDAIHLGWSRDRMLSEFLQCYNRLVDRERLHNSLRVDLSTVLKPSQDAFTGRSTQAN